jgi:hypothetical protein
MQEELRDAVLIMTGTIAANWLAVKPGRTNVDEKSADSDHLVCPGLLPRVLQMPAV